MLILKQIIAAMKRIEISICLGSSCFARGNQSIVHQIKEFLWKNKLNDRVFFKGAHCFNACKNGPTIKINDEFIYDITAENVIPLITKAMEEQNVK